MSSTPAAAPQRSKHWPAWLAAGALLNLVVGWVAALPTAWGAIVVAAVVRDGPSAFQQGPVGSAALVAGISLAILIVLFILANRAIRRLTALPAGAYWPLAVILALVPSAVLLLLQ